MTSMQLDFFSAVVARDEAPSHQAVTDLIASDPIHERERAEIVRAMLADHRAHGHVNPNCVRDEVASWVGPRVLSAMYGVLRRKKVLVCVEKEPNRDAKGRNLGKESKVYAWVGGAA